MLTRIFSLLIWVTLVSFLTYDNYHLTKRYDTLNTDYNTLHELVLKQEKVMKMQADTVDMCLSDFQSCQEELTVCLKVVNQ